MVCNVATANRKDQRNYQSQRLIQDATYGPVCMGSEAFPRLHMYCGPARHVDIIVRHTDPVQPISLMRLYELTCRRSVKLIANLGSADGKRVEYVPGSSSQR